MVSEIKITAHVPAAKPQTCRFTVDRQLYGASAYFWSRERAELSPLAKRLFELPGVAAVRVEGADVTVTRDSAADWRPFAGKVAEIIRAHIREGGPAVSEALKADLKVDLELKNKVQLLFDTQINPAVASHGGHIDLVDVKDGRIYVRMEGGCQGCASSSATLRQGIEASIRDRIPEVAEIVDVTDHAAGANPYYQSEGH